MSTAPKYGAAFAATIIGIFLLNFATIKWGFKPYLYCTFKDMLWAMYSPLQLLISLAGVIGMVWFVAKRKYGDAFLSAMVTLLAYLGPQWFGILFSLGKGCA